MSLKMKIRDRISRCENCGRRSLSPVIIEGHAFCCLLCHGEWRRERGEATPEELARHPPLEGYEKREEHPY